MNKDIDKNAKESLLYTNSRLIDDIVAKIHYLDINYPKSY
jgi:hypothetical protein